MRQFHIFKHPNEGLQAVKVGYRGQPSPLPSFGWYITRSLFRVMSPGSLLAVQLFDEPALFKLV